MTISRSPGIVILCAVCWVGACASAPQRTLAGQFIRQGTPSVDLGGPRPVASRLIDRQALLRAARTAPPPAVKAAGSLEVSDPHLHRALAQLALSPTTGHYLDVADEYMRLGINDRALDYLRFSIEVNGASADAYDAMARLWRNWNQPGEALGHAHRAVYMAPLSPAVHNTLGTVLYRLGRTTDAKASFARAFALDEHAWYALANLCHVNMQLGETRTAIDQCRRADELRKRQR